MAKDREVAEGTTFRLDTADVALEFGWHVESTRQTDEFKRDEVTIAVQYSPDDDISNIARWGTNREREVFGRDSVGKGERLRTWLAGPEVPRPADPNGFRGPKLRWSREKWLHKPTQEVVDNSDPRVPRTIDAAKKQSKIWYPIGNQANVDGGYYRRDMDMDTGAAAEPTYTATWNPKNSPAELLTQGTGGQAYWACVRHYQANYNEFQKEVKAATAAGALNERSRLRRGFFEKYLSRVAAEHPDWTSRKASTYDTLLTLPTGTSRAVFQVGFTRGGRAARPPGCT
jgi:hypothetical protein